MTEDSKDHPKAWGRLVPRVGDTIDLTEKVGETGPDGQPPIEFHEYMIGRNTGYCDVPVTIDTRVSGKHCRIFCMDGSNLSAVESTSKDHPSFNVYIENLSGNGSVSIANVLMNY